MLTIITSTWGIMAISGFLGAVVGHGLGYDSCFKDKIWIMRNTEYLLKERDEFLDIARKELKTGIGIDKKMSKEYYDTARKFAVKVGVHHDC